MNDGLNNEQKNTEISKRELEVLALVADGKTYKQIAAQLHVSTETVKMHLKNIYRKLKVSNKIEALKKLNER